MTAPRPETGESPLPRGAFPATHWSMVLHAGEDPSTRARAALETLCRQYWYPLYAFARRQGRSHHEAQDCTQEFLAALLATGGVARARPERGRFRGFLLTALRNFLTNEWRRAHTVKRGRGQTPLSLEFEEADRRFVHEPVDPGLSPEQAFDRNWARGLIERVLRGLKTEYTKNGRGDLFAALAPFLWSEAAAEGGLDEPAQRLGMKSHALTMALHRLRRRLGERVRAAVAETVDADADVDAELRYLIAAAGNRAP